MKIIGVTGPSGSGKTVLTKYFDSIGIPTVDADRVYHSLLIPPSTCLNAIREKFGNAVFLSNGNLDRVALGAIVFNDPEKLKLLNSTVLCEKNIIDFLCVCADYIIDIGPEGGNDGGCVVATGTPEEVAVNPNSHTGKYLAEKLTK